MKMQRAILAVIMAQIVACGPSQTSGTHASKAENRTVDFRYFLHGETYNLSELRGKPLTLVLMRTSDIPSQVFMDEIKEAFPKITEKTAFLMLTIDPAESPFVRLYAESENLPFPIGVAEEIVLSGGSQIGKVPVVPTTYIINSAGAVKTVLPGIVEAEVLVNAVMQLKIR